MFTRTTLKESEILFTSIGLSVKGKKRITKIVTLKPAIVHLKIYNLGFGNLESDGRNIIVNDSSISNNNDHEKVLNTVFSCMLHFLKLELEAQVIFFGNTEHKHLYYKRRISANIEKLQEKFNVLGCTADYRIETVETEYIQQRKNGKTTRKK
jgi:hypothetical protein